MKAVVIDSLLFFTVLLFCYAIARWSVHPIEHSESAKMRAAALKNIRELNRLVVIAVVIWIVTKVRLLWHP